MKYIVVSDELAKVIDVIQKNEADQYNYYVEQILKAYYLLNQLLCIGRDNQEVNFFADRIIEAIDTITDYSTLIRTIRDCGFDICTTAHYEVVGPADNKE